MTTTAVAARNPLRGAAMVCGLDVVFGDIGTSQIYTFRE
jgi:K+ transporter